MSEGKAPVDPLARYIEDPNELKDFRKALEGTDAIVQGRSTLSVFCDDFKPRKKFQLSIVIHKDTDWTPIWTVLEKNQYELCASPGGGLLFSRRNQDDLLLIFYGEGDLGWKHENSLQKVAIRETKAQGLGCFMTSKYAILFCPLARQKSKDMEDIRQSIRSRYNARSGGSGAQRWAEIDDTLICVEEVSDLAVTPDSFNWYLSSTPIAQVSSI